MQQVRKLVREKERERKRGGAHMLCSVSRMTFTPLGKRLKVKENVRFGANLQSMVQMRAVQSRKGKDVQSLRLKASDEG